MLTTRGLLSWNCLYKVLCEQCGICWWCTTRKPMPNVGNTTLMYSSFQYHECCITRVYWMLVIIPLGDDDNSITWCQLQVVVVKLLAQSSLQTVWYSLLAVLDWEANDNMLVWSSLIITHPALPPPIILTNFPKDWNIFWNQFAEMEDGQGTPYTAQRYPQK